MQSLFQQGYSDALHQVRHRQRRRREVLQSVATPLSRACPKCAYLNAPDVKFCAQCAVPLGGQAAVGSDALASAVMRGGVRTASEQADVSSALEGERKTVMALFADIKGSTELMEDLDPQEARSIIDPA